VTYLAILAPLLLALFVVWVSLTTMKTRERAFERREQAWLAERKELLNKIMYLAEKPWEGPEVKAEEQPPSPPSEVVDPILEVV